MTFYLFYTVKAITLLLILLTETKCSWFVCLFAEITLIVLSQLNKVKFYLKKDLRQDL